MFKAGVFAAIAATSCLGLTLVDEYQAFYADLRTMRDIPVRFDEGVLVMTIDNFEEVAEVYSPIMMNYYRSDK